MAIFRFSKIRQKMKNNQTDPIFSMQMATLLMYHYVKFGADLINHVQNFPSKPKKTPK